MEYTTEEKATIVVMKTNGSTFEEIQKVVNEKFGNNRSIAGVTQKYYKLVKSDKESASSTNWKDEPATTRQLRTLAYLTNPSGKNADRSKMVSSLKKQNLTKGQVSDQIQAATKIKDEITKTTPSVEKTKETSSVKKTKSRNYYPWTDEEIKLMFELVDSGLTQREVAEKMGRSFYSLQKKLTVERANRKANLSAEQEDTSDLEEELPTELVTEILSEPEWSWSHSQDMQILTDFYEMSIDEVRTAFARPYWVVAQRLEMLFDSTEPEHISMLMEASEVVLKRKRPRTDKPSKPSRKERREAKKAAKKAAKVARLEAKMERKLNALRGVKDE